MKQKIKSIILNKHILLTFVALIEVFALLTLIAYSWIPGQNISNLNSSQIDIDVDAGLRVNYGDDYSGMIMLPNCMLYEASSVDGRNIYFPSYGSGGSGNTTETMKFRHGNADDVNKRYIAVDFTLSADAGAATVYINGDNTRVTCDGNVMQAARISFVTHDGSEPKVFAPGVAVNYTRTANAITAVNSDGIATAPVNSQVAQSLYAYSYPNEALFSLEAGEVKKITMIVWLEGTDTACTSDIEGKPVEVYINFGSTVTETKTYRLADRTPIKWLDADNARIFMCDTSKTGTDLSNPESLLGKPGVYEMFKTDNYTDTYNYIWTCQAPEGIENIMFVRMNPDDPSSDFNKWVSNMARNEDEYTYVANSSVDNRGYWTNDTSDRPICLVEFFFSDAFDWLNTDRDGIFLYYWNSSIPGTGWPGEKKTVHVGTNSQSQKIFMWLIPEDTGKIIVHSNAVDDNNNRTYDIENIRQSYDAGYNAVYPYDTEDIKDRKKTTWWTYSPAH